MQSTADQGFKPLQKHDEVMGGICGSGEQTAESQGYKRDTEKKPKSNSNATPADVEESDSNEYATTEQQPPAQDSKIADENVNTSDATNTVSTDATASSTTSTTTTTTTTTSKPADESAAAAPGADADPEDAKQPESQTNGDSASQATTSTTASTASTTTNSTTQSQATREVIGSIPDNIQKPPEATDVAKIGTKGFEADAKVLEVIQKQFETETKTLKLEKNMFYRYVIGYRHIKNEKERIAHTIKCLDTYFGVHKSLDFDTILSDSKRAYSTQKENEGWPVYVYGQDRQGHVVIWDEIGSTNVKKLDEAFRGRDFSALQLHRARLMRRVENLKYQNQMKYKEEHLYKHTMVFDLKEFSLKKHGAKERRGMCKKVIEEMTNMYPECVFRIFVINAPGAFRAFYQAVKIFMDPITADKTKVLGKNYLKELVKDMDIEMIPPKYGGKGIWDVQLCDVPKGWPQDAMIGM